MPEISVAARGGVDTVNYASRRFYSLPASGHSSHLPLQGEGWDGDGMMLPCVRGRLKKVEQGVEKGVRPVYYCAKFEITNRDFKFGETRWLLARYAKMAPQVN
ncbi:MAG: hypothetical protein AABZ67_06720 [Pseudomonadota bacterium]